MSVDNFLLRLCPPIIVLFYYFDLVIADKNDVSQKTMLWFFHFNFCSYVLALTTVKT